MRISTPKAAKEPLTGRPLELAARKLERWFDPIHGGFGAGPKFPTVPPLSLMLRQSARTGDPSFRERVLLQLRAMAAGGIYDHVGGGFHRYAVDAEWRIPHFEKMLYDIAQLVRVYVDGWRLTKDARFREVVQETLEYLRREMTHQDGAFFAAQDADSQGREGGFFVWTPDEIEAVLGRELGGEFCRIYGVTPDGNFEGTNVLHRLGCGQPAGEESDESVLKAARLKLLAARDKRVRPQRDENIVTSWNAMTISALFDAAGALGIPAYGAAAEKALTFLLDYAVADGRVYRTVAGHCGRFNGYLDDAAWLAAALLDAFESTFHRWYLDQAVAVTDSLLSNFWDEAEGACFFTSHDHERLIHRLKTGTDGAIASGNAVTASVLLRLFSFTGEGRYYERAERIFRVFHSVMMQNPYSSAALLCSLDWWVAGPKEIVILGERGNALTEALLSAVHQRYIPNRIVLGGERLSGGTELPFMKGKARVEGRPTAYVCHRQTCSAPVTDAQKLGAIL